MCSPLSVRYGCYDDKWPLLSYCWIVSQICTCDLMTCFTLWRFVVHRMLSFKGQPIVFITIPYHPFNTPEYCIRSIWTCLTASPCYTTSSIRSIWTYLTASPCYTTSCIRSIWTCLTAVLQTHISSNRQKINAVVLKHTHFCRSIRTTFSLLQQSF